MIPSFAALRAQLLPAFACIVLLLFLAPCIVHAAEDMPSLRAFTSDGCSLFPDGTVADRAKWCDCCFEHDLAYWQGGAEEERKAADAALRDCVRERTGDKALAETMRLGVRAGGHPAFPTWYRWGYGWDYGRGYRPLTDSDMELVGQKLDEYRQKHPGGYCRSD